MEHFLVVLLGSIAVILALIGASYYRAPRPAAGNQPAAELRPRAQGATIAMAGFAFLLFLVTLAYAGISALQWRAIEAQTRELTREHRAWVYATPSLNGPMIVKAHEISL